MYEVIVVEEGLGVCVLQEKVKGMRVCLKRDKRFKVFTDEKGERDVRVYIS